MTQKERGSSLIEVMIASGLMVTMMAGLMSIASIAMRTTENQGHLATRTVEYAQDKMEQLLALAYGDAITDTTAFPSAASGGTGLTIGGSVDPSAPVAKYVDWLDDSGNLCGTTGAGCAAPSGTSAPTGWFYQRVWKIESAGTSLKKISVLATIKRGFAGGNKSSSTLVVLKSDF